MVSYPKQNVIVFTGGGQYFFWKLGVIKYLRQHFDMSKVKIVGVSAGSLASVCLLCDIDVDSALIRAVELCDEFRAWDRFLKVIGIWSSIVEKWLDEILPDDCHIRCTNRVFIGVAQLFQPRKFVSQFNTKKELVECLLTSCHIPFVMNYWPFRWFDNKLCFDGSFSLFGNDKSYEIFDQETHKYHYFVEDNYSVVNTIPIHKNRVEDLLLEGYEHMRQLHIEKLYVF